jgi:hypothetical protein
MKSIAKYLMLLTAVLGLGLMSSCEREIDIALDEQESKIVVEGLIEPGMPPRVLVSKNRGFFNDFPSDFLALLDTFIIQDATVQIEVDGVTHSLQFVLNPLAYPYAYYTSNSLLGEVGKTYTLKVEAMGKSVRAVTTIPPPVALDSMYFDLNVFNADEDSLGFLFAMYTDPDTLGNAYRLYAKRNSETEYFPVEGAIANDQFINGRTVTFFSQQSTKPFAAQDTFIEQNYFYRLGDTIMVKFCHMGQRPFEFYNTFEAATGTNGNPFASPILIKSNIEGGLGVWCGQSFYLDTLIATK